MKVNPEKQQRSARIQRRRSAPHSFVTRSILVTGVLISLLCWYCVGVVEKESMRQLISDRVTLVGDALERVSEGREMLIAELSDTNEVAARAIALMLLQNPHIPETELGLEELLALTGLEEICITDAAGDIIYTTISSEASLASKDFLKGVSDNGYSGSVITGDGRDTKLVSAAARLDSSGVIQVTAAPADLLDIFSLADIENVTSEYPLLNTGFTAIIDKNSRVYLSHTTSARTGTVSTIIMDRISGDKGSLFAKIDGRQHYICYKVQGDYVIIGAMPKNELFSARSTAFGWTLAAAIIICIIANLALRTVILRRR